MGRAIASVGDPKGVQGGERKATLLASIDDNFAVSNSPWAGIDAPTPAREQGLQPYGALYCFEWRPKVSKGERREAGIQWIQPPKAVSDPEFRQTTSGAHGSANRADCLSRGKPFGAPAGAYPLPRLGPDAPTTARMVGLPPREG